jgi:signal transduction histidine kinase
MAFRLNHTQLLRYAGLFTWVMVGISMRYAWNQGEAAGDPRASEHWWWWLAFGGFGLAYWRLTRGLGWRQTGWLDTSILLLLTVSAVAVSYFTSTGLGSVLLMVIAGLLPWLLSLPAGIVWMILSHLAVIPVFMREPLQLPVGEAVMVSFLYAGFSSFVFVTGLVAKQQAQAREDQRRLNAELRATRALLAESSRMSERLRISRELHDLLGHHLTALSLNLEVATHLTEGKAQDHVKQSHALARLLLTDVREAVSQMRVEGAIDLGSAIRTLVEGIPSLEVELDIAEGFSLDDADRAQMLLRCAQEIITNTLRHAGARHLWLAMKHEGGQLQLVARDDGRGAEQTLPGNGLRGMRERLAEFDGRLDIRTAPGQGFTLTLTLPLESRHDPRLPG